MEFDSANYYDIDRWCDERAVRTILAQDSQVGLPNRLGALALALPLIYYGIRNTVTTSNISSAFLTRSFLSFFSLVSSSLGNLLLSEYLWFIAVPCRDIIVVIYKDLKLTLRLYYNLRLQILFNRIIFSLFCVLRELMRHSLAFPFYIIHIERRVFL